MTFTRSSSSFICFISRTDKRVLPSFSKLIRLLKIVKYYRIYAGKKWVKGAKFENTGAKTPHISRIYRVQATPLDCWNPSPANPCQTAPTHPSSCPVGAHGKLVGNHQVHSPTWLSLFSTFPVIMDPSRYEIELKLIFVNWDWFCLILCWSETMKCMS